MSDLHRSISEPLSVVLFFTRGVSLRIWDETGMFEREVALYRHLQSRGVKVTFVTYGGQSDLEYQNLIPGIKICCNRWNLPASWYCSLIPWLHRKTLKIIDLIKTNQTCGADIALTAARYWDKPLLARCGYMWSKNVSLEYGGDSERALESLAVEEKVFCSADHIAVTTSSMRSSIQERFSGLETKISVIPNYVDTGLFTPAGINSVDRPRVCCVCRLEQEKNLEALIEAVSGLDIELEIIGCGTLHDKLNAATACNSHVKLIGMVPNNKLPDHFHRCVLFILPSLYEGHPKSLLEAMACGMPVIGTDVSGINEIITHGENGWLSKPDAGSIRKAIQEVLADKDLQERLGSCARRYVAEHYAVERIVEMELEAYQLALGKGRK